MNNDRYISTPGKFHDKTGLVYGRLKVISRDLTKTKLVFWICECSCGKTVSVSASALSQSTKSCGCLQREAAIRATKTHGLTGTREYRIYQGIKHRCYYENDDSYAWYGAKGIKMCPRWRQSFIFFYEDMGPAPSKKHTIDRIDSTKDYSPENCKWATYAEQQNNRSSNRYVELDGVKMTVAELAKRFNFPYMTILNRLNAGLSPKDAVSIKHLQKKE